MQKPKSPRVDPPTIRDVDLCERVIRALQDSDLHVCNFLCLAPSDEPSPYPWAGKQYSSVEFAGVTDGVRGFLLIHCEWTDSDTMPFLENFVRELYDGNPPANDYAITLARFDRRDPHRTGKLNLCDPARAQSTIEAAYESAFAGKATVDVQGIIDRFCDAGHSFRDERECRDHCANLDCILYPDQIAELAAKR